NPAADHFHDRGPVRTGKRQARFVVGLDDIRHDRSPAERPLPTDRWNPSHPFPGGCSTERTIEPARASPRRESGGTHICHQRAGLPAVPPPLPWPQTEATTRRCLTSFCAARVRGRSSMTYADTPTIAETTMQAATKAIA